MLRSIRMVPAVALIALAPAGCMSDPMGPEAGLLSVIGTPLNYTPPNNTKKPGPSTAVTVTASVSVSIPGQTIIRESGPGNNGGTCGPGGRWTNPGGQTSSSVPHTHCTTATAATQLNVKFVEPADFILAPGGNVQLNFASTRSTAGTGCGLLGCVEGDRASQYNAISNYTTSRGVLKATDGNGGTWSINLTSLTGPGNLLNRAGTSVSACNGTHGCQAATLVW